MTISTRPRHLLLRLNLRRRRNLPVLTVETQKGWGAKYLEGWEVLTKYGEVLLDHQCRLHRVQLILAS